MVIGAGAAGLAAAWALSAKGLDVLVLEARDRTGGRCWTRRASGLDVPVELGAEFLHGEAEVTHRFLGRARIRPVNSVRTQRWLDRGRLAPINGFVEAKRAFDGVTGIAPDTTFERFLSSRQLPRRTRVLATMMVQGFDAADPRVASARSIFEEWGEGGSLGASQPRPEGGYGALMDWLTRECLRQRVRLQLGTPVTKLEWRRGSVTANGSAKARKAIVTLPLGVLQQGPMRFPQKRQALRKLASGPVIRVAMRFHERFWEKRSPGTAFFHVPDAPFPTFWTPLPMRAALLTAWAGGPKAAALSGRSDHALVEAALQSVGKIFPREIEMLAAAYVQDWQADPFSRGGYSYARVGGEGAREELAAPLAGTIFFAGEATDAEEAGTVNGALRSGLRAAAELRN